MRRLALIVLALLALWGTAAAQVSSTPQGSPFEFPVGGVTQATRHIVTIGTGSFVTLDSVATGNSGVIRSILIADTAEDTTTVLDMYLVIKYDGSAVSSDSFPLAALLGYCGAQRGIADTTHTYDTPFWERRVPLGSTLGAPGHAWALRYPIPYTNGIVVRLATVAGTHSVWVSLVRQTQLPACWNRTYRFHVSHTDSTIAAANVTVPGTSTRKVWFSSTGQGHGSNTAVTADHIGWAFIGSAGSPPWNKELVITGRTADTLFTIGTPDLDAVLSQAQRTNPRLTRPEVFFRRSAGAVGYIASVVMALSTGTGDNSRLEACPRFYLTSPNAGADGTLPIYTGTGFEDFFNGVGYTFAASGIIGGLHGARTGVTGYDANNSGGTGAQMTGYRIFDRDLLNYTNGCSATFTNWGGTTCRMQATVAYYERQ